MILPAAAAGSSDPRRRACLRAVLHRRRLSAATVTSLGRARSAPPAVDAAPGNRAGRLFLWLVGAAAADLSRVERAEYHAAGVAVAGTAILATVSMTAALTMAVRLPLLAAAPAGLLWGVLVGNLDRWIVASTARSRGALAARLLLAVILGAVVAEPLMLRIFQPEINAELTATATHKAAVARRDAEQLVSADRAQLKQERARLAAAVADAERAVTEADRAYAAEVAGTAGTGRAGQGPASARHLADGRAARARLAAARDAYAAGMARLDQEAADLDARVHAETERRAATIREGGGLLARHEALQALIGRSPAMAAAAGAVMLLLVMVKVLPAVLKTLRPVSSHDGRLAAEAALTAVRERTRTETECARIESAARVTLAEIAAEERARLAVLSPDSPEDSPRTRRAELQEDSAAPVAESPQGSARDTAKDSPTGTVPERLAAAYARPAPPGGWTSRTLAKAAGVSQKAANEFLKPRRNQTK